MKHFTTSLAILVTATTASAEPVSLGFDPAPARPHLGTPPLAIALAATNDSELQPLPAGPERTVFGLPKNVGTGDRILRTVIGLGLLGTGIWGLASDEHLSSTTSGVLMGVSAVPLATAATGYCPLYQVLGIDHSF